MTNSVWQGKRIRLRAMEPEDWEVFFQFDMSDWEAARCGYWVPFPRSQAATRDWATRESGYSQAGDEYRLVIETLQGEVVGTINTHRCDRRNGTFSYGVGIFGPHRGNGYAQEAILLVLAYYFHELRYQKVNVSVYDFNQASLALHYRLGFVPEGRLRRNYFTANGFHDELLFGMTADEFEDRWAGGLGAEPRSQAG